MDRWDAIGATGAALVGGGVWALRGAPWAAIFWGLLLLAFYVVRETAPAVRDMLNSRAARRG